MCFLKRNHLIITASILLFLVTTAVPQVDYFRNPSSPDTIRICALRVEFQEDTTATTTGNGRFLQVNQGYTCSEITIDPPPHNVAYFRDHIKSLGNYFSTVSRGKLIIDTVKSAVFPESDEQTIILSKTMDYYNPYEFPDSVDFRLAKLFEEAVLIADQEYQVDFSRFDAVVIFHAGLGQDFQIFLDKTPEDIPSTYLSLKDLRETLGGGNPDYQGIPTSSGVSVQKGVILPECQNFLLFSEWEDVITDASEPCHYQFGLNGTLTLMMGYLLGLPALYDTETGRSGIGRFGLMDQGSSNFYGLVPAFASAWERFYMGWEEAIPLPEDQFSQLRAVSLTGDSSLWMIPINDHEYFLLENRFNYIEGGVDFDSLRYRYWLSHDKYPDPFVILRDTIGARFSPETGVLLSVPNYDVGLPGSGLLIWHVDDHIIRQNITDNKINSDPVLHGVDLEEADGAQDLGYPSPFFTTDVETGWLFDLWFAGNEAFFHLNPDYFRDQLATVGFTPYTHPNTNSNSGAKSFISITKIGRPDSSISLYYERSLPQREFRFNPEYSIYISPMDSSIADYDLVVLNDSLYYIDLDRGTLIAVPAFNTGEKPLSSPLPREVEDEFSVSYFADNGDSLLLYRSSTVNWQEWERELVASFPYKTVKDYLILKDSLWVIFEGQSGERYFSNLKDVQEGEFINLIYDGFNGLYVSSEEGKIYEVNRTEFTLKEIGDFGEQLGAVVLGGYLNPGDGVDFATFKGNRIILLLDGEQREFSPMPEEIQYLAISYDGAQPALVVLTAGGLYQYYYEGIISDYYPIYIPPPWDTSEFLPFYVDLIMAKEGTAGYRERFYSITAVKGYGLFAFRPDGKLAMNFPISYDDPLEMGLVTARGGWLYGIVNGARLNFWKVSDFPVGDFSWSGKKGVASAHFFQPARFEISPSELNGTLFQWGSIYLYPNPIRGNTGNIRFRLLKDARVQVTVYDLAGDKVMRLKPYSASAGLPQEIRWEIQDLESGVYYLKVKASTNSAEETKIIKAMVIR